MFGFWIGVNLLLPFLVIYWLINPDFLFYQKPLKRVNIALVVSIVIFIDVALLVLMVTSSKQTNNYDIIGCIIGIITVFCMSAWRFYRYGQYSVLAKLPKQPIINTEQNLSNIPSNNPIIDNNTTIDNSYGKHTDNLLENNIENTAETQLNNINTKNTKINQNEDDWQSYKQRMEQSWQETRTKIAQKSGEK